MRVNIAGVFFRYAFQFFYRLFSFEFLRLNRSTVRKPIYNQDGKEKTSSLPVYLETNGEEIAHIVRIFIDLL